MPVEIAQHGHCHVCGRVVKYGKAACSEKCEGDLERTKRGRKRTMIIMYVLLIAFILYFVFMLFAGGAA